MLQQLAVTRCDDHKTVAAWNKPFDIRVFRVVQNKQGLAMSKAGLHNRNRVHLTVRFYRLANQGCKVMRQTSDIFMPGVQSKDSTREMLTFILGETPGKRGLAHPWPAPEAYCNSLTLAAILDSEVLQLLEFGRTSGKMTRFHCGEDHLGPVMHWYSWAESGILN